MSNSHTHFTPGHAPVNLMGLPFHPVTLPEAASAITVSIASRQRCFLSTPNLNFTVMAQQNLAFRDSVLESDLVIADGMPLIWVAKFLGLPVRERVAGSDLFQYLSVTPRSNKLKVFFFGGEPGIAERASEQLNLHSQGLEACGFYDPGFVSVEQMNTPEVIQRINQSQADFVLVALGAQKGQQWIMHNADQLKAPVISHLGAVINFVAGHVQRAPSRWQKFGLEWLWRIRQEPKLAKRYGSDGLNFLGILVTQVLPLHLYSSWLKLRTPNERRTGHVQVENTDQGCEVLMSGWFEEASTTDLDKALEMLALSDADVVVVGQDILYLDAKTIAKLCLFQTKLLRQKRRLFLRSFSSNALNLLRFSSVLKQFRLI